MEFGQAYCQDVVKIILNKFTMYFSEFYCMFYVCFKFYTIFKTLKLENRIKMREQWQADFGLRPQPVGSAQWPKPAHGAQANGAARACPRRGHRAQDAHGGARSSGSPMTSGRRDLWHEYEEVKVRAPGNSNEVRTHQDNAAPVRRRTVAA
jgi:hypothetical protein